MNRRTFLTGTTTAMAIKGVPRDDTALIQAAIDAAQLAAKYFPRNSVSVVLRPGRYRLERTLVFR